jgi:phosphoglycerol transferase MdoB-like AlkP superfamily enzyme
MKKIKFINEITLSIALLVLVIFFFDPFMLWMPTPVTYMFVAILFIVFSLFAGFIWHERPNDEREQLHKILAARIGYLAGVGVLILALSIQTFNGHPDPWLIVALVTTVLGKLGGLLYSRLRY